MRTLRVMMVSNHADKDYKANLFKGIYSVLNALRKTAYVEEVWMVQNGGSYVGSYETGIEDYNAFSFSNANEIMEKLRPDIVLVTGDYEFLARSILIAANKYRIASVLILSASYYSAFESIGATRIFLGRIHLLKERGKSILRRYFFLLKTLFHSDHSIFQLIRIVARDCYTPMISMEPRHRFGGKFALWDLAIVSNIETKDLLIGNGINEEKIIVAGDCSMDEIYHKIKKMQQTTISTHNILFITTAMVEHGYWTPNMRRELVSKVVHSMKQRSMSSRLVFKIHPTSEQIEIYQEIVHDIDPAVKIIQNADILELISNSEVIVTYGQSTAIFYALLLSKPVIVLNIFAEDIADNRYLSERVVLECRDAEELIRIIDGKTYEELISPDLNAFIKNTIYLFDGKCGERAANHILSFLTQKNSTS